MYKYQLAVSSEVSEILYPIICYSLNSLYHSFFTSRPEVDTYSIDLAKIKAFIDVGLGPNAMKVACVPQKWDKPERLPPLGDHAIFPQIDNMM